MSGETTLVARMEQAARTAAGRGADCEVWAVDATVEEVVCRAGDVERKGTTRGTLIAVSVWLEGREGTAVGDLDQDPHLLVEAALSISGLLPPDPAPPRPSAPRAHPRLDPPPGLAEATAEAVVRASRTGNGDERLELALRVERRTVGLLRQGDEPRCYQAGAAQLTSRLTIRDADRVGFFVEESHGPDPAELVKGYLADRLTGTRALARILTRPPAEPPAAAVAVLLDGNVVTELLHTLVPALQADTVARGLSRLTPGTRMFAPALTVADDLTHEHSPIRIPWDDEGTPARRTELVRAGVVSTLLADRRTAHESGAPNTAAGWRGSAGETATVRPGFLVLELAGPAAVPSRAERVLRVVQSNGAHTTDEVTGNFSIGANAVWRDAAGEWHNAGQITVAGNMFTMLDQLCGHDGDLYVRRDHDSYYASPGLWVTGLSIGHSGRASEEALQR